MVLSKKRNPFFNTLFLCQGTNFSSFDNIKNKAFDFSKTLFDVVMYFLLHYSQLAAADLAAIVYYARHVFVVDFDLYHKL